MAQDGKTGERAVVGAGGTRDAATGKWTWRSAPMRCPTCGCDNVTIIKDDSKMRVNSCDNCGAAGVITKGELSWWYHDWEMPSDMNAVWHAKVFA